MKICVMTLTRDRADYTRHCFGTLLENAGCDFDHYVLDQASDDDTLEVLGEYTDEMEESSLNPGCVHLILMDGNVGIHRGWNLLLDTAGDNYDVYVTFDNDCEVTMHGTLNACAEAAMSGEWIVTPTVCGLHHPLTPGEPTWAGSVRVGETPIVGGICRAMPGWFVREGFRFNESMPIWGGDETWIAHQFPGRVGWLLDWTINHYKTTAGQQAELPGYFTRKFAEMT